MTLATNYSPGDLFTDFLERELAEREKEKFKQRQQKKKRKKDMPLDIKHNK